MAGTGRVIGVDLTAATATKARRNAAKDGYERVEMRLGEIEALSVTVATGGLIVLSLIARAG